MNHHYTIACDHPETKVNGSWIFVGESHRTPGTSKSPVFPSYAGLAEWMKENHYRQVEGGAWNEVTTPYAR